MQCPRPLPTLRNLHHARLIIILILILIILILILIILIIYQIQERCRQKCGPRLLLQSRSRELWVRQLVMRMYHRRRRFLQYNFMDPSWGEEFPTGGAPLPPLAPALIWLRWAKTLEQSP